MTHTASFDVIVIGSGAVGQSVAYALRAAGRSVAVIERRTLGGTCPNRGCDAKKPFVNAAASVDHARRLMQRGIASGGVAHVDWAAAQRWSATFWEPIHDGTLERLRARGVDVRLGVARFIGPLALEVGGERLEAHKIVVATGSRPRPLTFPGTEHVITSDELMLCEEVPAHVAFIGGGFISFEFAHVLARAQRRVTIVHAGERPLEAFEARVVDALVEASRAAGIEVRTAAEVTRVAMRADGLALTTRGAGQATDTLPGLGMVVHGAGRVPDLADLDLDVAGIEAGPRGIPVDQFGRARGNAQVYVGGDVADAGHAKLLRVASHHARVIRAHLLGESGPEMDPIDPVSVVFTSPALAGIGLTEAAARAAGLPITVYEGPADKSWKDLRQLGDPPFAYKTIVHAETDAILGAWVLGEQAAALINLVALASAHGVGARAIGLPLYGYPTVSGHVGDLFR